jgi:hypothetical protein
MLAVDVGRRLHRFAGREVVELRASGLVRLYRDRLRSDAELHQLVRDVVREIAADDAH